MLEEFLEFLEMIWNLRTLMIIGIAVGIIFLIYCKIIQAADHTKNVFGKGDKKDG